MQIKKLEIFNNIILLSNKKINKDILHLDNGEIVLSYLRQNALLLSNAQTDDRGLKSRIVICISDPYLTELATLVKEELFEFQKDRYQINILESKDFYMEIPKDVKLVIFVGQVENKYARYCLAHDILLINVVSPKFCDKSNVYYLPFKIDNLSSLIWLLLFYKNI